MVLEAINTEHFQFLKIVELVNNRITDVSLKLLEEKIPISVKTLNLGYNLISAGIFSFNNFNRRSQINKQHLQQNKN